MAEREVEHKRVVVETPNTRREYERAETTRYPERNGVSGGVLAAVVVGIIALAAIVILFVMNRQQTTDETLAAQQQPSTTIVQQPAAQPPVIVTQPATTTTQPAPIIVNNPPASGSAPASGNNDGAIQTVIDKKLNEDSTFKTLGITTTVLDGKVTLLGVVKSEALKAQIERAVRNIKGVTSIDNQISVG